MPENVSKQTGFYLRKEGNMSSSTAVIFLSVSVPGAVYLRIHDLTTALAIQSQGRWPFVVGDDPTVYVADDRWGRTAIKQLFTGGSKT